MTRFEFATAGRVVFGAGTRQAAGDICRSLGRTALVVTGGTPERAAWVLPLLEAHQLGIAQFMVPGEPSVPLVQAGVATARHHGADVVIAIGGGSVIDAAKAIAALVVNSGDPLEYLEVVGRGQPLPHASLPVIAVPTTAGTGCEVTRNAVLTVPGHRVKVSLRHASMLPRVAMVDPELTLDLPPAITATTGLDALTQLIEPYLSSRANAMTDALCLAGMRLVAGSIRAVCRDGHDIEARTSMSLASVWSGMALANAGLGAVHGLAGPIGGMSNAPHGAVCAALLPHVCATNLRVCRDEGATASVDRFATMARVLTGDESAGAGAAIVWLRDLIDELAIPGLGHLGVDKADVPSIVAQARQSNSMKSNPVELTAVALSAAMDLAW